jgi:repressor LexA
MLTRKQHELLTFIDRHLKQTGFSPSFEEMKEALQLKSKSGIHRLISALEERGFLRRRHHRARALEVVRLPEIAGLALAADAPEDLGEDAPEFASSGREHAHTAQPSANFSPNVIRGDFTGRFPGVRAATDAVAVQLPLYGRIAAGLPIEALNESVTQIDVPIALLGGGDHYALEVAGDSMVDAGSLDGDTVEVTLKRLRRRGNSIALEPANQRHETRIFPADRVKVQGRLIALLRRYP